MPMGRVAHGPLASRGTIQNPKSIHLRSQATYSGEKDEILDRWLRQGDYSNGEMRDKEERV